MAHKHHYLIIFIISVIIFFCLPFYLPDLTAVQAVVVINEIFPKPVPDETDEWIELYNTGPDAISLGNWRLENTSGTKKTYTMAASAQIPVGGIITLYESQTGLSLNNEGDGVNLYDPENKLVDSQTFVSTLGFNNSIGRSTDGAGIWTVCSEYSENHLNGSYCPLPTNAPTPSLLPSSPPLTTLVPTFTPFPIPTTTTIPTLLPQPILVNTPTTTTPLEGVVILTLGLILGLIALLGGFLNWRKHRAN